MAKSKQEQPIRLLRQSELQKAVTSFIVDRQARGLSCRTVEYYSDELRSFQSYLETRGVCKVQAITADLLRQYLLSLQRRRNAGGCHAAFRALRAFMRWAWAEFELSESNPIRKIAAPKLSPELLEPVSMSAVKAMLQTCGHHEFVGDRDRAILLCLLDTGLRASEFLSLNVEDVTLSSGAIAVKHAKGNKSRVCFIGNATRRELLRYLRHVPESGALWLSDERTRLTYAGLRHLVRRRALKAGVAVPSLHSFRRAFALACLRQGMDVYSLQKLMGHSDLTVLRRYLQQTEQDLKAAHDRASPVDRMAF